MNPIQLIQNVARSAGAVRDALRVKNLGVLRSMLGPAYRGLIEQRGKHASQVAMPTEYRAIFNTGYERTEPELGRLYSSAKLGQWNGETDLDWSITVDPHHPTQTLAMDELMFLADIPQYRALPKRRQEQHKRDLLGWSLSQFLHGEQGALFAACQLTEAMGPVDAKLYGSTQVVDEGRHVEVFHRYLTEKIERLYQINDNLYVLIDALMSDSRWDLKFLTMQILLEGLALGAFGLIRQNTEEPLLKSLLKYVITDEARHVHFGVVALREHYQKELSERERREREDWAFEASVLMRNRFFAYEFYDEHYAHVMNRAAWERLVNESRLMEVFRNKMFRRIVPNLKRIGLVSPRIRPHYQQLGLLAWEHEKAAPELQAEELFVAA